MAKIGKEVGFWVDVKFDMKFEPEVEELHGPVSSIVSPGQDAEQELLAGLEIVYGSGGDLNVSVDLIA